MKKKAGLLTDPPLTSSGERTIMNVRKCRLNSHQLHAFKKVCHRIGISCSETNNFLIAVAFCTAETATPGMLN